MIIVAKISPLPLHWHIPKDVGVDVAKIFGNGKKIHHSQEKNGHVYMSTHKGDLWSCILGKEGNKVWVGS